MIGINTKSPCSYGTGEIDLFCESLNGDFSQAQQNVFFYTDTQVPCYLLGPWPKLDDRLYCFLEKLK